MDCESVSAWLEFPICAFFLYQCPAFHGSRSTANQTRVKEFLKMNEWSYINYPCSNEFTRLSSQHRAFEEHITSHQSGKSSHGLPIFICLKVCYAVYILDHFLIGMFLISVCFNYCRLSVSHSPLTSLIDNANLLAQLLLIWFFFHEKTKNSIRCFWNT